MSTVASSKRASVRTRSVASRATASAPAARKAAATSGALARSPAVMMAARTRGVHSRSSETPSRNSPTWPKRASRRSARGSCSASGARSRRASAWRWRMAARRLAVLAGAVYGVLDGREQVVGDAAEGAHDDDAAVARGLLARREGDDAAHALGRADGGAAELGDVERAGHQGIREGGGRRLNRYGSWWQRLAEATGASGARGRAASSARDPLPAPAPLLRRLRAVSIDGPGASGLFWAPVRGISSVGRAPQWH